ncbi:hypothetical protein [Cupriavidus metallidurans]|uniref:hypothetical protein n=1 Tax=Cupriavidus metallidurans TaxID=119219 RepID=UPI001CC90E25|nr:hypothetical protein [Cupriavidus metallidurans]UBM09392.1 hypothetical protein LAI70_05730 [Cupriavidus metallidurans]
MTQRAAFQAALYYFPQRLDPLARRINTAPELNSLPALKHKPFHDVMEFFSLKINNLQNP